MNALLVVPIGIFAGLSIGVVGVGGVILVPLLSFAGISVHSAIAASMMSYVFCGLAGTAVYGRLGSITWRAVLPLALGAAPGALAGALLAGFISGGFLLAFTAGLVLLTGGRAALGSGVMPDEAAALPARGVLVAAGAVVGCAAALTGTGGPLLLVPLLLLWRLPALQAVGLGQAVQVPIATAATLGYLIAGTLDPSLGVLLAIGVVLGSLAGARVAHWLPAPLHSRLVGLVLLLASGLLALRLRSGPAAP